MLLLVLVAAPALVFAWGYQDGQLAFVLYREPKLIAASVLGWGYVCVELWRRQRDPEAANFAAVFRRPAVVALAAFLSYLTLTGLWVRVHSNYFYELNQYLLLFVLLVLFLTASRHDTRVSERIRDGLVASLAVVTLIGGWQYFSPLTLLTPINPDIGASHPSLMGYKNPAALALLGQIFLLAELVFGDHSGRRPAWQRVAWGVLLGAEILYLVTLRSRTAYVAFLVAALFLMVASIARNPTRSRWLRATAAGGVLSLLVLVPLAIYEPARERALSLTQWLTDPSKYFETDRGTYLLNTLNMARHQPWGVGLGDWQTHYPVYRLHNRSVGFDEHFQARRAHSDHVQFLGEAGWLGWILWMTFLVLLIGGAFRHYWLTSRDTSLYPAAQLVALATAMSTDYLIDLPYNKFQFFLVASLTLARTTESAPASRRRIPYAKLLAIAVTAFAVMQMVYYISLARKVYYAAAMEKAYLQAVDPAAGAQAARSAAIVHALAQGREFAGLTGHTKTFFRAFLVLAHSAHLSGHRELAGAAAAVSLELHPNHPNTLLLMSTVVEDRESANRWREAYDFVMNEATRGWDKPYPTRPEPRRPP